MNNGYFGAYGGRFVPETLMEALLDLERAFHAAWASPKFRDELHAHLSRFAGRPTPLYRARRLEAAHGLRRLYLKREDLCHTGAHKINNSVGQALLARAMRKRRIVCETGAGQHGVATASVCAMMGLECVVYMGRRDVERQRPNVERMRHFGARVIPVASGSQTLKDAINEALRDWVTNVKDTHYLLGSVVGPHPYPLMVRRFHSVIGEEARRQILREEGRLPDAVVACVGGGSNAIGIFSAFLNDRSVRLIGVEAEGAASVSCGSPGVLHGCRSYVLQDHDGQIRETNSIAPGLDYPGVGPEHSSLRDSGRVRYVSIGDRQALAAFRELSRMEGILPALESSHALAYAPKLKRLRGVRDILVNLSGRGDKDLGIVSGAKHA